MLSFLLWLKGAHESAYFWDFQEVGSKFIKFLMSILKRQVNSSSNFASFFIVMTHSSSVNFKLKVPILRLSSAVVKICQIPHVVFQTTSQFFFKFCITLQCHETLVIYFFQTFWVLKSIFIKFLMSILKQQVNASSNFSSFFSVLTRNCVVLL